MLQSNERSKSQQSLGKNTINNNYKRTKSLFLDSVMNNNDNIMVNPNTLKNLKDKIENPFKMPKHNEELFEMQDVLNKEVEYLKTLNKQKYKTKKIKPDYNSDLYLTETKEEYFNQNYTKFIEKFKNFVNQNIQVNNQVNIKENSQLESSNDVKVLQLITEKKEEDEKKESNNGKKVFLQKKIDSIGGKKRDNVREYINKTREIVFMKYTLDMKKERAVRIKETYKNELESIKDSIISMQDAKKIFEKEFYDKFEKYVKYLSHQKEKEKTEENNLLETKLKLESENKRLIAKIKKFEENKEKLEEYRDFLICVKEKKLKLPEFYKKIQIHAHSDSNKDIPVVKRNPLPTKTMYLTELIESYREQNILKEKKTDNNLLSALDPNKKYEYSQIFNSLPELIDEIKKMQNDNVSKLSKYNEVSTTLNDAQKNIHIMKENDKNNFTYIVKDMEVKENLLRELKDRNKKLTEEKTLLMEESKVDGSKNKNREKRNMIIRKSILATGFKNKFHQPKLFARIFEVFKSTKDLVNYNFTNDKLLNINADSGRDTLNEVERKMLLMLQHIERTLDLLLEKKNYYRINRNKEFLQLSSILENDRKIKKTVEQKIIDQLRNEQKIKDIMDRDKKIQKLPKRILPQRYLPIETNKKEKKDNSNDKKDLTFEDLIYFG